MKEIKVDVDMREVFERTPFPATALKAKLLEAGMPVTRVTDTTIEVSKGSIYWEWLHDICKLHVMWQDFTLAGLAPDGGVSATHNQQPQVTEASPASPTT